MKTSKEMNFLDNAMEIASLRPSETSFNQLRFTVSHYSVKFVQRLNQLVPRENTASINVIFEFDTRHRTFGGI